MNSAWWAARPHPGWVITGCSMGGGQFMVLASATLTETEIAAIRDEYDYWFDGLRRHSVPGPTRITLRVEMRDCVVVYGESYAECMSKLFADWAPPDSDTRAVAPPRKELAP